MLTVTAPDPLDGARLRQELDGAGLAVDSDDVTYVNGNLRFSTLGEDVRTTVEQVVADHTGQPLPPSDADAARTRLGELYAKGWDNLTNTEKSEVPRLVVQLVGSQAS